jgi:hypothetical protein
MPKVPLSLDNAKKCICGQCPVQAKSTCAKDKLKKLMEMMGKMEPGALPKSEDLPALYCSTGKAACPDLDTEQECICGRCPVWEGYKLAGGMPMSYYCRDGEAK